MPGAIKLKGYRSGRGRKLRRRPTRLADKKINTLVEKRIVEIQKKSEARARAKTYVDYIMGSYNNSGWPAGYVNISHNPDSTLLSMYTIPVHDEDSTKDVTSQRLGNYVWVRGFRITGSLRMAASTNNMNDCRVKLVLFSQKRQVDPLSNQILTDLPVPVMFNELSGALPDEDQKEDRRGIQVHATKIVTIRPTRACEWARPFRLQHFFKVPQKQMFEPTDTSGQNPLTRTYFMTAYSDRDLSNSDQTQPSIVCNARAFYYVE